MATNVTEKDKTLNDVIEWCGEQVSGIEKKMFCFNVCSTGSAVFFRSVG